MQFTTKINIKVKGFTVPDYLNEDLDPMAPYPPASSAPRCARTFDLSEIPTETLDKMCYDFKREVFKRAGKAMLSLC